MYSSRILKLLCSIPVIIVVSYLIPFIGVCLIITRYFVYGNKKYYFTSLSLIAVGVILTIPKIIVKISEIINSETGYYLSTIINSEIYSNLFNYSKFLIGAGIIFLIVSLVFKSLFNKLSDYIRAYISTREKIYAEAAQKNDMEMKIKQQKAKNTQVVYCPHCGADNILTESVGNCKYCRRSLNNKR